MEQVFNRLKIIFVVIFVVLVASVLIYKQSEKASQNDISVGVQEKATKPVSENSIYKEIITSKAVIPASKDVKVISGLIKNKPNQKEP